MRFAPTFDARWLLRDRQLSSGPQVALSIAVAALFGCSVGYAAQTGKPLSTAGQKSSQQKPWGIAGDPKAAKRSIALSITDKIRLSPEDIQVAEGETLKIVLTNNGTLAHEFVIGTRQTLEAHAALMIQFPDKGHDETYIAQIPAGKMAEIVWTFNKPGIFDFACPLAGHFLSGAVGKINVAAAKFQTR